MKEHDCRQLQSRLNAQGARQVPPFAMIQPPTIGEIQAATVYVLRSPGLRQLADQLHLNETDREDVFQETLFKAWRARERYSPAYALRSWVARIARNAMLDLYRKQRRRRCSSLTARDGETIDPAAPTPEPLRELIARETAGRLEEALAKASPLIRRIAELRQAGLSFAQVAGRLGRSHSAVVSTWHRFKVRTLAGLA
jgi:RNA polymerase sigma-70 factor (ECF subfamily)